jgi:hypothetical protein
MQLRTDDPFSEDVLDVQQLVVPPLGCQLWDRRRFDGQERSCRFVIGLPRRNRHQLAFGITKRREFPAKYATRVDVDRPVQPLGLRNRSVTVDYYRSTAILGSPVASHREAKLIRFTCCLPIQREIADLSRPTALHLFLHPSVSNHELAVVEHIMAHKAVEERTSLI